MRANSDEEDPLDVYMKNLEATNEYVQQEHADKTWGKIYRFNQRVQKDDMIEQSQVIRNRRYQKLQELLTTSDYFSNENMESRHPALYHLYFGKYVAPSTNRAAQSVSLHA